MSKHTKEPWHYDPSDRCIAPNHDKRVAICTIERMDPPVRPGDKWHYLEISKANAERIVACVNACAGMEDPQKEIEALKYMCEAMVDIGNHQLKEIVELRVKIEELKEEAEELGYELVDAHERAVDVDNS